MAKILTYIFAAKQICPTRLVKMRFYSQTTNDVDFAAKTHYVTYDVSLWDTINQKKYNLFCIVLTYSYLCPRICKTSISILSVGQMAQGRQRLHILFFLRFCNARSL